MPGQYSYIVINFGSYAFQPGLFQVTGNGPVNILPLSALVEPNGIDHSQEKGGGNANVDKDWDLCNTGTVTGCSQTAGVWIGHGNAVWNLGSGALTDISGTGVSFHFDSGSGGFVSTAEVNSISLSGPSLGALSSIGGLPTLFDIENALTGVAHLDGKSRLFSGLVYQARSASGGGGGVEIEPIKGSPTLIGQVLAYRLALFGGSAGTAIDFSGYWSGTAPVTAQLVQ
jgi:hypothetical protein